MINFLLFMVLLSLLCVRIEGEKHINANCDVIDAVIEIEEEDFAPIPLSYDEMNDMRSVFWRRFKQAELDILDYSLAHPEEYVPYLALGWILSEHGLVEQIGDVFYEKYRAA